ncbi:MAG: leucine-rich repeat domain-containing protein [Hominimerdicola sp.]
MALDLKSFAIGKANGGGGRITVEKLTATENGTYTAESGKAFNPVVVDVQSDSEFELLNDGKWHFYFDFTTESQLKGYLGIYVKSGAATIDFGDGTPLKITSGTGNTYTYHEYSALGKYRVDVEGDINITGDDSDGSYLWRPYIKADTTDKPKYLYRGAKYGLCALKFVEIPDGVTYIGHNAFNGCTSLQNINIPNGITEISRYAFNGCTSLQNINIPDGVTYIGYNAFSGCASLRSINIPNGITRLNNSAFRDCTSLQNINIPDGVTYIGSYTFYNDISLQSINIPNTVTNIMGEAFSLCYSLTGDINIPVCTNIGAAAFSGTSIINYIFTDWTADDIANCTFGTTIFAYINSNQKIVFATQEIAEVAKETTNLATYASYIHYVGEEE